MGWMGFWVVRLGMSCLVVDESGEGSSDGSGGSLDGALDRECSGVLLDETLFTQTGLFALEVACSGFSRVWV